MVIARGLLPGPSFERHHGEESEHRLRHVVEVELVVEPATLVDDRVALALLVQHVISPDTTTLLTGGGGGLA